MAPSPDSPQQAPRAGGELERDPQGSRVLVAVPLLAVLLAASIARSTVRLAAPGSARVPGFIVAGTLVGLALYLLYLARVNATMRIDDAGVHRWSLRGWRSLPWTDVVEVGVVRVAGIPQLEFRDGGGRVTRLTPGHFRDPEAAGAFIHARTRHARGNATQRP